MKKRLGSHKPGLVPRRLLGSRARSPFVGRVGELRQLAATLKMAAEGQGGTVFLTGLPGIGKTRMAQEAIGLAKARGFTVLEGRAFPLQDGLAYGPILSAFDPLLRTFDPSRLATLVKGLPDLGRLFAGLDLPSPEPLGDPAIEKARLFGSVSRLLERLAQAAPVVLFIDDLNWADPASLDLLHFLARALADQPALVLASYRTGALEAASGLQALVESLERHGLAEEIVVPRLEPDVVEGYVREILDGDPPAGLLSILEARASGTPFFIEALIAALIDSGILVCSDGDWRLDTEEAIAIPPNVRRLVLRCLAGLVPDERRIVELLSVLGDVTSHAVLRAASGMAEENLLAALRPLQAAGLVAEGMDGTEVVYSIAHPIVQEVTYAEMPQMMRRRAHVAAIEALETFSEGRPDDANRLARHYHGAGPEANGSRALEVLFLAGERALTTYANDEAARHYGAALAMIRKGGGLSVESGGVRSSTLHTQPSTLCVLLERLGEALERIGRPRAAAPRLGAKRSPSESGQETSWQHLVFAVDWPCWRAKPVISMLPTTI